MYFSNRTAASCRALLLSRQTSRRFSSTNTSRPNNNSQKRWALTSVAATTALASFACTYRHDDDEVSNGGHWKSLLMPDVPKTACFADFLSMPSRGASARSNTGSPSLRRQQTVELIQSTAALEGIDSKYKVDWNQPIGMGTFGAVFKATDRKSGQTVAVKKIPKHYTNFATFQREMDALLHISKEGGHPNINALREHFVGENGDDSYYLVLDMIEGGEMFDHLCAKGPYSEADAAQIIRQVASALAFLHGIGIVHSDLKPENLMLTSKDTKNARIQLVDFGCAHKVHGPEEKEDHSHRGTASTPAYCPPEVLKVYKNKHAHIEPGFDLWSLGVILYVMLTGMHPFDPEGGSTNDQIEARVIAGEVPPLKKDVSGDARALIEGLMNMDPSQRWTAGQLLEHPWVQGKTASSRKIPKSDDRLRTYRRHKTAVGKHFFRTMLMQSSMAAGAADDTTRSNMCLLESAFRQLDQNDLGYLSTKTLHGDTSFFGADAQLSLSEVSDLLSENMANRYLPKGHVLYSEGEKGDSMFFLNSGSVEVTSKEGLAKVREAGDFFGEDALTRQDKVYGNTVVCKTAVHVIEVSREYYEKYVQADESVALTMAETDRLRGRERANTILSLQKSMKHKDYQRGDTIFEQGSAGDNLYIVEEGNVDIFRDGHKVRSLHKGEMTGEHAAYHKHKPYNVSARCVGDSCKMGILKSTDMHRLFKKNPSLEASFYDIILRRDFKKAICSATKRPFPETEGDLRAAFEVIDTNKSGVLELDKLRRVMLDFDPSYKEEDIQTLLKSMDLSKSGSLTWKEFKHVFGMAKES